MVNTARSALSSAFQAKNGTPLAASPYCKVIERYV